MTSINTNIAATTALRTLQSTNMQLESTQSRISTGLKIGEAKDNAAYWSISTSLKSDNKAMGTVKDALGLGAATVDTAYQGLNAAKDVLDEIKSKLTAATQPGVDKSVIQSEIAELQNQLKSIAGSSIFSGENWLSVNSAASDYNADKKIVASFARDGNNNVSIGTIAVDISSVSLFDASTTVGAAGILDKAVSLVGADGRNLTVGGTSTATGNLGTGGIAPADVSGALLAGSAGTPSDGAAADTSAVATGNTASGVLATGAVTLTGVAASDRLTFSFSINGAAPQSVSFLNSDLATADADGLAAAIQGKLTDLGVTAVTVADGSTNTTLEFDLAGTGSGDTFQLLDVVVTDASGRAKNPATVVLGAGASFVASTAGTYTTANLTLTTVLNKTATLDLNVNGSSVSVDAAVGADINEFVANLNANGTFAGLATAAVSGSAVVITSATTGATSKIDLNSIVFKNADGTVFNATAGTAFENIGQAAKVTTGTFVPVTLDSDDDIKFDIKVNNETGSKIVTIDRALIDKTLGTTVNGKISTISDYEKVMDAALTAAAVTGVKTTVAGQTLEIETTTEGGTKGKIALTKVGASAGGSQISVSEINIDSTAFNALTSDETAKVLSAYVSVVNQAINKITTAASTLGSAASRIELQQTFVTNLMDTIDKGVSGLVDADMNEESTRLQALQVKQQLGVQALSIANQSAQNVLSLFR